MPAWRTNASIPDAAKPHHFCLEVEARFPGFEQVNLWFSVALDRNATPKTVVA
jgi:hypothetical protein